MTLDMAEKLALSRLISGFDQAGFELFLNASNLVALSHISANVNRMPEVIFAFINWLETNPQYLIKTLDAFIAQFPAAPDSGQLINTRTRCLYQVARCMPHTPWDAALVERVPVINRTHLRGLLQNISNANGPSVVVIDGPTGTGKTHSFFLIKHVAVYRNCVLVRINLAWLAADQRNLATIVPMLARELNLATHFSPPHELGVTAETRGVRYAENFAVALRQAPGGRQKWLVFDSLELHKIPEIHAFVATLITLRLRQDIGDCTFFLLDAGPSFAFEDPCQLIANERLGKFSRGEIDTFVQTLNSLGTTPLAKPDLDARSSAIQALLAEFPDDRVCAEICKKASALRSEVSA
jgi:hypothetical protein